MDAGTVFWDGTKITTIALLIAAIPDIAMLRLGRGLYTPAPVLRGWVFLFS